MGEILIREASPADAEALAELMNLAGEGIPAYLWSRDAGIGTDLMKYGARRVARPEGAFSYRNAWVARVGGAIAGMLLGYLLPEPYAAGAREECPDLIRPMLELEALAAGSWYVNAIATFEAYRGRGVAARFMQHAEELASGSGAGEMSLIVAGENTAARTLYRKLGYRVARARPIVPFPGFSHGGDWVLMKKTLESKA